MEDNIKERLEKLKEEAIANPPKKVKGCKSCKKKKEVEVKGNTELPSAMEFYYPTEREIKEAYVMLRSPKDYEKPIIDRVYYGLFKERFDFDCQSCANKQARRLGIFMETELKLKI